MRKCLAILILLVLSPFTAWAVKRVTVEQLEQTLSAAQLTHRGDEATAQQLVDMKLTARLDSYILGRLMKNSPGPKTSESLRALADSSAFLDPPPAEVPSIAAPDLVTQKAIMAQVIHYVAKTLPTLPNFLATRVTEHYYDALPGAADTGDLQLAGGLLPAGKVETPIAYRDGRETDDPSLLRDVSAKTKVKGQPKARSQYAPAGTGLSSWGEFGPILGVVLVDAAKGKLGWQRWEQHGDKRLAVFQFSVDRSVSHYNVQYCCVQSSEVVNGKYGSSRGGEGPTGGLVKATPTAVLRQITGYHGHLDVDPETGTILSITIEADLRPDDNIQRAAIQVEYGPVPIGDKSYVCPTHSVSLSETLESFQRTPTSAIEETKRLLLNDVEFTGYHRFRSETVMVENAAEKGGAEGAAASEPAEKTESQIAVSGQPAVAPLSSPASVASSGVTPEAPTAEPASTTTSSKPAPISAAVAAEDAEFLVKEVDGLPGTGNDAAKGDSANGNGTDENANKGASGEFTLKVTTRLVDVGLVAYDKHNKPVTDLKLADVEIYDNGRKQQLKGFHHPDSANAQPAQPAPPSDTFTNASPVEAADDSQDTLIFMLDESHLAFNDLNRARAEVLRFLTETRPNARFALYAFSEHGYRVIQELTPDHALIEKKLAAWQPSIRAVAHGQDLDKRNTQQIDEVRTATDLNNVNGNFASGPEYIDTIDPQLRKLGENPLRGSLEAMVGVARHFSSIPGHKSIAWIAGDSVLADWEDRAARTEKGPNDLNAALLRAREELNEAHIALYAVDATVLEASGPDASLENQNVLVNPTATANNAPGASLTRNTGAGRMQAQMQSDLHGIQGPVVQLVEATGGRAIRRGSDLKKVLDGIEEDSTALYELTFNPDTQADGKFHTLQIKIPSRKDVKLRYRTGYLYTEEATSTKQRFQEAIWSPQDAAAIHLTAETAAGDDTPSGKSAVKLRIALAGLDLEKKPAGKEDRWSDQLYIYVAQRDDATQRAQVSGETLRLSLKQATYDSGIPAGIPYQRTVEPSFKQSSLRLIVVDGNSGRMGSVTIPASALHP